jgi:hypothetical protein
MMNPRRRLSINGMDTLTYPAGLDPVEVKHVKSDNTIRTQQPLGPRVP